MMLCFKTEAHSISKVMIGNVIILIKIPQWAMQQTFFFIII